MERYKPRWELLQYDIVARIAEAMSIIVNAGAADQYVFDPGRPRSSNLINGTMFLLMDWKSGNRFMTGTHFENLAFAAAHLFLAANEQENEVQVEPPINTKYVRWDMLPISGIEKIAIIFDMYGTDTNDGRRKYDIASFKCFADCMAHFKEFISGHEYDSKTGIKHVYFAIWNMIMMMKCDDDTSDHTVKLDDVAGRPAIEMPGSIARSAKRLAGFSNTLNSLNIKPAPVTNQVPKRSAKASGRSQNAGYHPVRSKTTPKATPKK